MVLRGVSVGPRKREGIVAPSGRRSRAGGRPKDAEDPMETSRPLGICSTCDNAETCSYLKLFGPPLFYCDEHEGVLGCVEERVGSLESSSSKEEKEALPPSPQEAETKYKGLCKNCAIRATCTYPKPEGGVWHCEEYC